ncbi:MAG: hypothetical protein ACRDT1_08745 [Micromonosporaceae bacterium]
MPRKKDPQAQAIKMLRAVSQSGFGIISAIQAQSDALNELIQMVEENPLLNRPEAADTLDLLHRAKDDLNAVYDMALDATVETWSITALPDGLTCRRQEPAPEASAEEPTDGTPLDETTPSD